MFIDEVRIKVKSGKGGDGIVAWRREKYIQFGGPAGGDGGKGGSVVFRADEGLSTLLDLRYRKVVQADDGEKGKTKNMHGANAEDIYVTVPVGTIVYEEHTNRVLCDLTKHEETAIVAPGGRGGRGNWNFATSRNQAPEIQENGHPGITVDLRIELKLLADVGLIGFPSVGKSTLISVVSESKPKIADYPFTTLVPNLGVVNVDGIRSFVMADMPGIIEGASKGVGLGLRFLKHIERTRVIVHIIDMSAAHGRDPYEDYLVINRELAEYKFKLSQRPQILVANKMDMPEAAENLRRFREKIGPDVEIVSISALTTKGVHDLLLKIVELLDKTPFFDVYDDLDIGAANAATGPDFEITHPSDKLWEVVGPLVGRLIPMTNFTIEDSVKLLAKRLRRAGVDDALRKAGIKPGDTVRIVDYEFEFID
ncbi:MAG: GTPase ObgE [Tenericutes bacterium GWF2_57_13]|nr:MAG: GTPase ObgE [Tenericutes bacterium GWF2_57_13]